MIPWDLTTCSATCAAFWGAAAPQGTLARGVIISYTQTNSPRAGGDLGWHHVAMQALLLFQTRSTLTPKVLDSSIAQHWKHPVWWSWDTEDIRINPLSATSPTVLQDNQDNQQP